MANTIRFKRRTGSTGAPSTLWQSEPAYNELDHILYLGEGTGGSGGTATSIIPIAGPGGFVTRGIAGTTQTIDGLKTFTSNVSISASAIDSTASSFYLFDTPATINFGALATALSIGANTGTTTVRNTLQVNGDFNVAGDTTYTGNVEVVGALAVDSGIITTTSTSASIFNSVATTVNAFGAATSLNFGAATGTTSINNSASITGTLAVNGGSITSTASTFNVVNSGVTRVNLGGAATTVSIGSATGKTSINNANTEIVGFLSVDTSARINTDLAVNGGNITTTSLTGNVFNTTATTLNVGGAATSVNIGATSGTTTVRNNFAVSGTSQFTANSQFTGSVTVGGDLTVNGTFTTINSTVVTVEDKNLELGKVATPTDTTADGGGITLLGGSNKTITWDITNSNWTSSENWNLASGKVFKINNTSVLSSNTLGSGVIYSSLTTLGTIVTGTWNASIIGTTYGGTGLSSYTKGDILWASATNTLAKLAIGTYDSDTGTGQMLQVGPSNTVVWSSTIDGGTY